MFIADAPVVPGPTNAIVSTLDGVTTVLVAFLFVCLVMPSLVKNRPQYYAGLACMVLVILLHTLSLMFDASVSFGTLLAVGTGLLQVVALLLLVLCVGGLTVKELGGDMARAYEVIRRGETTKETIIPIGGATGGGREEQARKVYRVDSPPPRTTGPVPVDEDDDSIPFT